METNFFSLLNSISSNAEWKLTISAAIGSITIALLIDPANCRDDAAASVPPMILKGTAEELDRGFFNAIREPATETQKLFSNMDSYVKQVEDARSNSKMEADKKDRERKEAEDRKKKYDGLIKKVAELEAAEKWGEAIAQLPKPGEFPEQSTEIKTKLEELKTKHSNLSLF